MNYRAYDISEPSLAFCRQAAIDLAVRRVRAFWPWTYERIRADIHVHTETLELLARDVRDEYRRITTPPMLLAQFDDASARASSITSVTAASL